MMRRAFVFCPLALMATIGVACSDGNADVGHVGGPTPNYDASDSEPDAAGDAGPDASEAGAPIAWCGASPSEPSAYRVMAVCRRCHQTPAQFFAPFPLLTWDDTQRPFGPPARPIYQWMFEVVQSGFMPLQGTAIDPPVSPLSAEDKATLLTWIEQGAKPVGGRACEGQ